MLHVVLPAPDQPAPHPVHPPLVLVPVAPIAVRHLAALAARVRLHVQVNVHVLPQLTVVNETLATMFTMKPLLGFLRVYRANVLLQVKHLLSTDCTGWFFCMTPIYVALLVNVTFEYFATNLTLRCLL